MKVLPLEGILVVSCEQAVAAPFATRQLADLGARVIKVERPITGDFARDYDSVVNGMSSHFVWLNRSKESVALDLKDPASIEIMRELIDHADVFIQNFAPGAAERLGLGAESLRADRPRLITCSISGYGVDGPYRDAKAYDLLIQSETGLVSITGTEDHPAKTGIPTADIGAGMYAFAGVLAALYDRERTGRGTHLDVSLFDALVEWMGYPLYYTAYSGAAPARTGVDHPAIAPYGTYSAGDGTEFVLSIQNEREWESFCEVVLERQELAVDVRFSNVGRRVANRRELNDAIEGCLQELDGPTMEARLTAARVAHARRREVSEVLRHPQISTRDRWRTVDSPVGELQATLPVINLEGIEPRMDPIPAVGEHTNTVLAEFGLVSVAASPPAAPDDGSSTGRPQQ